MNCTVFISVSNGKKYQTLTNEHDSYSREVKWHFLPITVCMQSPIVEG